MSLLTNKHVLVAMIVSPILAIITYFGIDYVVKEKPHVAKEGVSYPLLAKSNCRYSSGQCNLENSDFKASLVVKDVDGRPALYLDSNHPLDGVMVGIAEKGVDLQQIQPKPMTIHAESNQNWILPLDIKVDETTTLAIAIAANGSQYFGETIMAFSKYEAIFKEDFRRQSSEDKQ